MVDPFHPHGHITRCGWRAQITREHIVSEGRVWYMAILSLPSGHLADMAVTPDGRHVNNQPDLDLFNYNPPEPAP